MVNVLALVEGEADYAAFIDYVNTQITHYKREVLGQKTAASGVDNENGEAGSEGGEEDNL